MHVRFFANFGAGSEPFLLSSLLRRLPGSLCKHEIGGSRTEIKRHTRWTKS